MKHQEYDQGGKCNNSSLEGISVAEFKDRILRTQSALADADMVGLVAYADCWRGANVNYFTDIRPVDGIGENAIALVLLPVDAEPSLFIGRACLPWAESENWFHAYPFDDLDDKLQAHANRWGHGRVGLAGGDWIPAKLHNRLKARLPGLELETTQVLAKVKAVKSAAEIRLLRRAAELTDHAMAAIRETLADRRPKSERELARIADAAMILEGADRTGYDSMVQVGPRSAFQLARPTDRILKEGDLVMTDIGARYRGYVADGGRGFTYGPVSADKVAIVDAAASAVEAGLAAVRPGITASDLSTVVQRVLIDSGYGKFSEEARGRGSGHGTGMDPVEEVPLIMQGNTTVLVPDMVFTLKATITVPEVGGLRIERIVRVTESGGEALDAFPMRLHW
ncbi:MAG: Xaa-Pro peptidase family protein [Casimicrobiaceae bacterium]